MEFYYTEYFLHGKADIITNLFEALKRVCQTKDFPDFPAFRDAAVRNTAIIDGVRILEDADKEYLESGEVPQDLSLYFVTYSCQGGDIFVWHMLAEDMGLPVFLYRCNGLNSGYSHTNDENPDFFYGPDFEDNIQSLRVNTADCAYFPGNYSGLPIETFLADIQNSHGRRIEVLPVNDDSQEEDNLR